MKLVRLKKSSRPLAPAPIRLLLGDATFELASPANRVFYQRLKSALRHIPETWGLRLPEMEFSHCSTLPSQAFVLEVEGLKVGEGQLQSGRLLALGDEENLGPLLGEADMDCIYGLPSKWILPAQAAQAQQQGCLLMDPESILMTLLMERLPGQLHKLLSLDEVSFLLEKLGQAHPHLVEQASARLPNPRVLATLRALLQERVPILRLDLILEGALRSQRKRPGDETVELARQALGTEICLPLCDGAGSLAALVLAKWLERRWLQEVRAKSVEDWFFLRFGTALEVEMQACWARGRRPVLLVDAKVRPDLAQLLLRIYPELPVLSWAEVPPEVAVETVATLGSQVHPLALRWPTRGYTLNGIS